MNVELLGTVALTWLLSMPYAFGSWKSCPQDSVALLSPQEMELFRTVKATVDPSTVFTRVAPNPDPDSLSLLAELTSWDAMVSIACRS